LVGYSRRNFMVPIPRFAIWEEFNAYLEDRGAAGAKRMSSAASLRPSANGSRGIWP
jgi:hypothetical protein